MLTPSLINQLVAIENKKTDLAAKKIALLEKAYCQILRRLKRDIKRFHGQRFAFRIKGEYLKKVKKDSRTPLGLRWVPYDYFYIGRFEKKTHRVKLTLFNADYQSKTSSVFAVPTFKLYLSKNDTADFKPEHQPLVLNRVVMNEPSWPIEQVLRGLLAQHQGVNVKTPEIPEVTFILGNEPFEDFVAKQNFQHRRMIKKLKL